jgi:hypothetical protein
LGATRGRQRRKPSTAQLARPTGKKAIVVSRRSLTPLSLASEACPRRASTRDQLVHLAAPAEAAERRLELVGEGVEHGPTVYAERFDS